MTKWIYVQLDHPQFWQMRNSFRYFNRLPEIIRLPGCDDCVRQCGRLDLRSLAQQPARKLAPAVSKA